MLGCSLFLSILKITKNLGTLRFIVLTKFKQYLLKLIFLLSKDLLKAAVKTIFRAK